VMDPIYGSSQLLERALPEGARETVNQAGEWLADKVPGISPPHPQGVTGQLRDREAEYQAGRTGDGIDGYRIAGNIAAGLPAGAAIPVGATMPARVGIGFTAGGAGGATMPALSNDFWKEKALQTGIGAGAGALTPLASGASARFFNPRAASNADLALLRKEGVTPTAMQAAGGAADAMEELGTSVPWLGFSIQAGRGRALREFNSAAINRAVAPVGRKITRYGQEGVDQAFDVLDEAYDAARARLGGPVLVTNNMREGIDELLHRASLISGKQGNRFTRELEEGISSRMRGLSISADDYKKIDSELGELARKHSKSTTASEQELGELFFDLRTTLREGLKAQNPEAYDLFRQADTGYANLMVVNDAAKRAVNNDGVFTPGQLGFAVRAADETVRKRSIARGKGLMQDLAGAGQGVLGNTTPNSGTVDRGAMLGWGGSLLYGASGAPGSGLALAYGLGTPATAAAYPHDHAAPARYGTARGIRPPGRQGGNTRRRRGRRGAAPGVT